LRDATDRALESLTHLNVRHWPQIRCLRFAVRRRRAALLGPLGLAALSGWPIGHEVGEAMKRNSGGELLEVHVLNLQALHLFVWLKLEHIL